MSIWIPLIDFPLDFCCYFICLNDMKSIPIDKSFRQINNGKGNQRVHLHYCRCVKGNKIAAVLFFLSLQSNCFLIIDIKIIRANCICERTEEQLRMRDGDGAEWAKTSGKRRSKRVGKRKCEREGELRDRKRSNLLKYAQLDEVKRPKWMSERNRKKRRQSTTTKNKRNEERRNPNKTDLVSLACGELPIAILFALLTGILVWL